jgi:hypothetical protein
MEQDISSAPVDPNSDNYIDFIGATTRLHPDFGAGLYDGQTMGIPYVIVSARPFVSIDYTAYGDQSDPRPHAGSRQCADRRISQAGQRRSPRARHRSRQLLVGVTVTPTATTTYRLYSTNAYGRSTAKVTVTVQ